MSCKEAAALLSRSVRTVRAQLARGELSGQKVDGVWVVDSTALPLTAAQRDRALARIDRAHDLVERALPRSARRALHESPRSMRDFEPFDAAVELLREARRTPASARVAVAIEAGLLRLAHAAHEFDPATRLSVLRAARERWCRAAALAWTVELTETATTVMESPVDGDGTALARLPLAERIERELIARLGGILRFTERQIAGRRRERT